MRHTSRYINLYKPFDSLDVQLSISVIQSRLFSCSQNLYDIRSLCVNLGSPTCCSPTSSRYWPQPPRPQLSAVRNHPCDITGNHAAFWHCREILIEIRISVSYDQGYDDASRSMSVVSCSDGPKGLMQKFPTQGDLPGFPYVGGAQAIAGWGSANVRRLLSNPGT